MNPNDPDVIALSKAIFQHESGGDFNAVGDAGTSHGAGQWQPATWKAQAKDVLGDENAAMTPQNQKAVIQVTIAKDKASGLNPAQIAAKWNSGQPDGWENKIGTTTINGQQIKYNVPAYVKAVTDLYQQNKQKVSAPASGGYNPTPYSKPTDGSVGQFDFTGASATPPPPDPSTLGGQLAGRGQDLSQALQTGGTGLGEIAKGNVARGAFDAGSGALQTAGAVAGGVGDLIGGAIGLIPGAKSVEGLLGKGVQKLAETGVGQKVVQGATDFADKHPVLSKDLGAVTNIAGLVGGGVGAKVGKDVVKKGVYDAAKEGVLGAVVKRSVDKRAVSDAAEILGSKPTKAEIKAAVRTGRTTVQGGVPGIAVDRAKQDSIDEVAKLVKDGTVSRKALAADNAGAIKNAADSEAEQMRSLIKSREVQAIVQPEELQQMAENVAKRAGESATSGENPAKSLMNVFYENLPKGKDVTAEDVLNARQAVSRFVLENKGDWNMRGVLTGFKSARNAFWDESRELLKKLAPDVPIEESLAKQSSLYRALDYITPNVKSEIGSTRFGRFADRHPLTTGLIKKAARYGTEGTAVGLGLHAFGE